MATILASLGSPEDLRVCASIPCVEVYGGNAAVRIRSRGCCASGKDQGVLAGQSASPLAERHDRHARAPVVLGVKTYGVAIIEFTGPMVCRLLRRRPLIAVLGRFYLLS